MVAGGVITAAFLTGMLVGSAGPAAAHTALKASSPKDGGKIDRAPARLMLEFTEPILAVGSRIAVAGPDGRDYQAGAPQIVDNKLTQPLKPLGPAGEYRVTFRIVAYDGHPLTNGMRFTLTKPGPAAGGVNAVSQSVPLAPVPVTSTSVNNAPSWAPWTAGAAAAILIIGAMLFGRRVTRGLDQN